jgi:hypothetical protein
MNDDVSYIKNVEQVIDELENNQDFKITKIIVTEEIDNSSDGTAYVTNNQNGMGNILSPQP